MHAISLAEAQERLGELLDEALAGEAVTIARDGGPAVRLVAVSEAEARPRAPIDIERLRRLTESQGPPSPEPMGGWAPSWRD